jgi:hypothetical protein
MESFKLKEGTNKIDKKQLQKLLFINNALDGGWSIKKKENSYIFSKRHENRQEIFDNNYLENFIESNGTMIK